MLAFLLVPSTLWAADRYWVGGTGDWSDDDNHWATTSGGAPGNGNIPTASDNVFFDANSDANAYTVSINSTVVCRDITFSAPASGDVTWAGADQMTISGSMTLYAGLVRTYNGYIVFNATTTGHTITSAGVTLASEIAFDGVGGEWTLQDAFTTTGPNGVALTRGSLVTNDQALNTLYFQSNNANTRALDLGNSTVSITGSSWNTATTTGMTFDAGTSTISISTTETSTFHTLTFGGLTLYNLTIAPASGYIGTGIGSDVTVSNNLTIAGNNSSTERHYIYSSTGSGNSQQFQRTITCNGTVTLTNVDFEDIVGAGSAGGWATGTSIGDGGGNSGITFTAPVTRYWVGGTGDLSNPAEWSATSGGAGGASMPLIQDTIVFDANSFSAGAQTVSVGTAGMVGLRMPALDFSNATNTPTLSRSLQLNIYGGLDLTNANLAGTTDLYFRGRSLAVLTSAGETFGGFGVYIDMYGGTLRLADNYIETFRTRLMHGTLDAATFNPDVTMRIFDTSYTNTRVIQMGSGTWTLTGTGTVWDATASTGLTVTPGASTIEINNATASTKTFSGGGMTYNNILLTGAGTGSFDFVGSNTFDDFACDTPPHTIQFTAGTTTTVTTFSCQGTLGNLITIGSITAASHTLAKAGGGVIESDYLSISRSSATPATTWYAGDNSTNGGNNSGWTFTAVPVPTVQWTASSQSNAETNAATMTVTAQLSNGYTDDVTVPYTITGTANGAGEDYTITASPIVIAEGSTTANITITIVGDADYEANETVIVTMDAPTNATQGATTVHTATITENDFRTVTWTASSQSSPDEDNNDTLTVTAELSGTTEATVTVPFTLGGTATGSGTDYTITASPITINAGGTTGTATITIVGDTLDENNETVIVTMGSPTMATQGATTVHTATITDDDATPSVTWTAADQTTLSEVGGVTITAQLSAISGLSVNVPYSTGGTAGAGDYGIAVSPLTIPAGSLSNTVLIMMPGDSLDEDDETIIVTMGVPTNASQGATTVHTVTITDDDASPSVTFTSASQSSADEDNNDTMTITAQLSAVSGRNVSVPFTLSGTATGTGTDYTITATPVAINAGSTTADITITIVGDTLDENDETVIVTMGAPTNASQGATIEHTATITDDDAAPTVTWTASSTSNPDEGNNDTMTVTAELSAVSGLNVSVPFTLGGTATGGGTDYSITASPISINAGSTTADITITIVGDTLDEANETVIVTMGAPTNASQGATTVNTATITDDDAAPTVSFTSASQSNAETNAATMTVTAQLSAMSGLNVSVPFTLGGTATGGGTDYSINASPVAINAGSTTVDITITIVGDMIDENNETVIVTMGAPTNASQGATTEHTATINDDDAAPTVSFTSASQSNAETNAATMTVTAQLSAISGLNVSLPYTVTGTATGGGTDYSITASPIAINAGSTTADITITIVGDALDESNETVIVTMDAPTNATQGATTEHTATITDDDASPTVIWTSSSQSNAETNAATMTVTAQISATSGLNVSVPFTLGGTATGSGTDYTITASPVTITAGSTTTDITITIVGDALDENNETVIVTMGAPTNASQGATTVHTATINDDDATPTVTWTSASQTTGGEVGGVTITAQLSATSGLNVSVPYTTGGTATAGGVDYGIAVSPLTITAGSLSNTVLIMMPGDSLDEADETIIVTMGAPTNASQGATTVHTVTIADDDGAPSVTLAANDAAIAEDGGSTSVVATLSAVSGQNVTVNLDFTGTAVANTHYTASAISILITAGDTTGSITLTGILDVVTEADRTIIVDIASITNADESGTQQVTVTRTEGDTEEVVVAIAGSDVTMTAAGTVSLDASASAGASNVSITYSWSVAAGSGSFSNASAAAPVYTAPSASSSQDIVLTLTVSSDEGTTDDDTLTVHVIPQSQNMNVNIVDDSLVAMLGDTPVYENVVTSQGRSVVLLTIGSSIIRLPAESNDYTLAMTPDQHLLIGLPHESNGIGRVYFSSVVIGALPTQVTLESDQIYFSSVTGNTPGDFFGKYVTLGDINGDSTPELLISAPGASDDGVLYVFDQDYDLIGNVFGSVESPISSVLSADYVTGVDEDLIFGPDNVALNLRKLTRQGSLSQSEKSLLGFVVTGSDVNHQTLNLEVTNPEARLGEGIYYQSMALGDVNGDGEDDLLQVADDGTAYVFFGKLPSSGDFALGDADVTITGGGVADGFGRMVAIGDVTGDDISDIIVGAPDYGSDDTGAIYVIFGGASWEATLDLSVSSRVVVVLGESRDSIGSDLMLADRDDDAIDEIYTLTGAAASSQLIYEIQVSDPSGSFEDAAGFTGRLGSGGGCSLVSY